MSHIGQMASICYPTLFRAVDIDGEYYWDGGYTANPSLNPLVDYADNILTVLIARLDVGEKSSLDVSKEVAVRLQSSS